MAPPCPRHPLPWAVVSGVLDRRSHTDWQGFYLALHMRHAWEPAAPYTFLPDPRAAATAAAATGP